MDIYCVGGCVRDELLGLPVKDRDWVVVGSTPQEMERLGYKPVGRDFPVFLHPKTREEYALARTERKVARGYRGFQVYASSQVTLLQDLERRDLTINAMARDAAGALIDPFGGAADLRRGLLRHVSDAFREDPVRILRVARFAARYGFAIAPETAALMREMVEDGESDALVAERVWREFSLGLMETDPWRMLAVLGECGLLGRFLPELDLSAGGARSDSENCSAIERALRFAVAESLALPVRFAIVTRGARGDVLKMESACAKLRVPNECRDLAMLVLHRLDATLRAADLAPAELLELIEACDALRRPGRMQALLQAAQAEAFGARGGVDKPFPPASACSMALAAARSVDAAAVAAGGGDIAQRLRAARRAAIEAAQALRRGEMR